MAEIEMLDSLPLFRGVDARVLDAIAGVATQRRLHKGEFLFRRGEPCRGLFIVMDGLVKLSLPAAAGGAKGAERAIEVFGPGAAFGEDVLFMDAPQPADCQAMTRTTVLCIGSAVLWDAVSRDPLLSARLLRNLSSRLHALMRDIEATSLHNASQRVAGFLCDEARAGRRTWLACTQRVMASKLGITPETLSRVVSRFCAEKLVRLERGKIFLLDTDGLGRLADDASRADAPAAAHAATVAAVATMAGAAIAAGFSPVSR
ncbi:Crp/Fnr family transcriptional regulator [Cupriavidus sp. WKF15]|uniref:Crp/Fnr family transcriptional regulator n=1 Tax=Cupriavidus sp. WKF15 TaxID=3032282 RepID=UPI0023E10166|nr:Crp/Fnr family transcriptional regulator [Cupriavidus sp. WKF15]WER49320.1 Crp/Fnr family transcriptional regulator [Cupriavidus sp. WKF15]